MRMIPGLALYCVASLVSAQCPRTGDTVFGSGFERPPLHAYHVAPVGDDGADGSASSPWATIQHAVDMVAAGDAICVHAGIYNELVTIARSGSEVAGPIVLQAVPGEAAVVDGAGLPIPGGQYGLVTLVDASHVVVAGLELRNYATASSSKVPIGLYVTGAGSDIRVLGNHIHDIRTTASGCAANAFGLKVDGTRAPASINHLVIAGNEIDHLVLGCSESFSLDGNVEQWTISGNHVHHANNIGIGAIGFEGVAPDPAFDQARDGTIAGNVVHDISSYGNPAYGNEYAADGIYVDGGTRVTIERNLVYRVDLGIELASEHAGRTTSHVVARSNIIHSGNSSGISLGGYAAGVGGTEHCSVIGNTLVRNDVRGTGSGELQIQYHASDNLVVDNVLYAGPAGVLVYAYTGDTALPAVFDHNLYWSDAGAAGASWTWRGTDYDSLAAWRTGSSQDAHSPFADPLFLDLLAPDLRVDAGSPAIDAGIDPGDGLAGLLDYAGGPRVAGNAIDIGAHER
ncbi:right-handed parallel beta-helix repeat-containing protein [Dokdonella fugitiva]|uniref:Parallel beta helix pectate lyase-like protein n=1 Tax=Dokdonella fugitiva TaxID=328517 RepID=A0A4R2IBQ4_9GAMM|nr:right-handed parallel beta-helix repeat-containing protein [Dokdonella fugitiva]TCO41951.1 parallel beta helix pectate lyase-like protein [Dokdonella fugitiva]